MLRLDLDPLRVACQRGLDRPLEPAGGVPGAVGLEGQRDFPKVGPFEEGPDLAADRRRLKRF